MKIVALALAATISPIFAEFASAQTQQQKQALDIIAQALVIDNNCPIVGGDNDSINKFAEDNEIDIGDEAIKNYLDAEVDKRSKRADNVSFDHEDTKTLFICLLGVTQFGANGNKVKNLFVIK